MKYMTVAIKRNFIYCKIGTCFWYSIRGKLAVRNMTKFLFLFWSDSILSWNETRNCYDFNLFSTKDATRIFSPSSFSRK